MPSIKYQHGFIAIAIFCLFNQGCYCNQEEDTEESNHTLLVDETEEFKLNTSEQKAKDRFNRSEEEGLKRRVNISETYHTGITLASWRWHEIGVYYTVSLFIIITGLSKVAFHHAKWLSTHIPESCLLIFVGIIVGSIIYVAPPTGDLTGVLPTFTPTLFFLILLPPVILESAYSLYNATFYENLSTILLFAVVGTIFNTFAIGFLLHGLDSIHWMGNWCPQPLEEEPLTQITLAELLIFSALISAVDPVAVLAIFQEVGVNKDLYFLIFGESLLNDAITVVLYNTMVATASKPTIDSLDITMAILSFFTVNLGGVTIGIIFGLITAIITKTTSDVRVVEPLAVLGMAYLAYLSAELFHFSGIISIIFCGLLQAHYAFKNISSKSCVTVKYFIKMLSSTSEAVIFLFLGIVLLGYHHDFTSGFIYWSIILCLIIRFIGIFALTAIANLFRVKRIQLQEQLITAYGGLRGAVGFSLVIMLDDEQAKAKSVYVTTTLVVILFTVFLQGSTIKPLVKLLNIEISGAKHKTLIGEINDQVASHLMAGIEEIIGFRGNFYLKRKLLNIDEKYFHNIFLRDKSENKIRHVFEKASLHYHYAHLYGPVTLVEDHKTEILHGQPSGKHPKMTHIPFVTEGPSIDYSGVELRRKGRAEVKPGLLKKAFQSNPFHKYFQRYNPNLIEDDTQEIETQLELRRQRANRITQAVYEPLRTSKLDEIPISDNSEESMGSNGGPLRSPPEQEYTQREMMVAVESILKRANRRRTIAHMGIYSMDPGKKTKETTDGIEMLPMQGTSSPSNVRLAPAQERKLLNIEGKADDSESDS